MALFRPRRRRSMPKLSLLPRIRLLRLRSCAGSFACPRVRYRGLSIPCARSRSGRNIFHVKYISEGAVYLDAGRNAGLEEGMLLHLVHADPNGGTTDAVRFQGQEPIADVRIFSVADSSSAAEIIKSREDLVRRRHRLSGYRKRSCARGKGQRSRIRKLSRRRHLFLRGPVG